MTSWHQQTGPTRILNQWIPQLLRRLEALKANERIAALQPAPEAGDELLSWMSTNQSLTHIKMKGPLTWDRFNM